jgi:TolA-binding protein
MAPFWMISSSHFAKKSSRTDVYAPVFLRNAPRLIQKFAHYYSRANARVLPLVLAVFMAAGLNSCGLSSTKKQYVLAETLWTEGNYAASVNEFEKVHARDPKGKLGLQALFRAAATQAFFLNQPEEAIRKYKQYAEVSEDEETAWEAQLQIGEILFMKLEKYDQAMQQYQMLLQKKPTDKDAPLFLFRVGKSQFFLRKFKEAVATWQQLTEKFPTSPLAEQASYEMGVALYTRGEQSVDGRAAATTAQSYQQAMKMFEGFIKKYPTSKLVPQAKFGIASCLEELDDLDGAYKAYEALKSTYPSPNVITVKLVRIRERKAQRNR